MFKKLVVFKSTVAILSMLPFFAAVRTDAFPPNGIKPNNTVALDFPVLSASLIEKLDPLTGKTIEQLDKQTRTKRLKIIFFIKHKFNCAYSFLITNGFSANSFYKPTIKSGINLKY